MRHLLLPLILILGTLLFIVERTFLHSQSLSLVSTDPTLPSLSPPLFLTPGSQQTKITFELPNSECTPRSSFTPHPRPIPPNICIPPDMPPGTIKRFHQGLTYYLVPCSQQNK